VAGECPGGWGCGLGGSLVLFLAVAYLSVGFRLFCFDAGGNRVGGFSGGVSCGVWRGSCGWWFWGFASRRGYAVTCRRLYGGVLLTAAAGFQSWARWGLACGFSPGRRCLVTGVAVFFALFLAASAAGYLWWAGCAACSPELPRWLAVQRLGAGVSSACGTACVGDDLCRRICPRSACLRVSVYTR